ncbi:MAG: DUF2948 family protein, partial [Rhodobacterales bacterium]|nr:DUF2948 family protein [Rhodobacterales bacterium]
MTDARFEDGGDRPLHLVARDGDDLSVIAALCQDAVLTAADLRWDRRRRRFAALLNRFRWEDLPAARAAGRRVERVRSLLVVAEVTALRRQGIVPGDSATVLSLLTLAFQPDQDGTGRLTLTFAGDGAIAAEVEALDITLKDVTRPY